MFEVNNKDRRRSGIFIVNFEHISRLVLVFFNVNLERLSADRNFKVSASLLYGIIDLLVLSLAGNFPVWLFISAVGEKMGNYSR